MLKSEIFRQFVTWNAKTETLTQEFLASEFEDLKAHLLNFDGSWIKTGYLKYKNENSNVDSSKKIQQGGKNDKKFPVKKSGEHFTV